MTGSRYFAIIPAAGHSQRMGRPKLLLPLGGRPLVAATIEAWRQSRVDHVLVVVRADDQQLADAACQAGAKVLQPAAAPPDMKASLQEALAHIASHDAPTPHDAFLVAPADMPRLSPAIIDRLLEHHRANSNRILVPTIAAKRGHPTLLPWDFAASVFQLGAGEGLKAIVERTGPLLVPCDDLIAPGEDPFADIDTPGDFERYRQENGERKA